MELTQTNSGARRIGWRNRVRNFWAWTAVADTLPRLSRWLLAFGVVVPAVGLLVALWILDGFDPLRVFTYGYSVISIATTAVWLHRKGRFGRWSSFVKGTLRGGAAFAAALGVLLLPCTAFAVVVSLVGGGPFVILVAFGLAPFAWALAFAVQIRQSRARCPNVASRNGLVAGIALPFLACALLQAGVWKLESGLRTEISAAKGAALDVALDRLFFWNPVVDVDFLFAEYAKRREADPEGAAQIEREYGDRTGGSLVDSPDLTSGPIEMYLSPLIGRRTWRSYYNRPAD